MIFCCYLVANDVWGTVLNCKLELMENICFHRLSKLCKSLELIKQSWLFNVHLHTKQQFLKSDTFLMAALCRIIDDVKNIVPINKQMLPNPLFHPIHLNACYFCVVLSTRKLKNHSKLVRDEVRTWQPWVAMHIQACFWQTAQPPHRTTEWPTGGVSYLHIYQLLCRGGSIYTGFFNVSLDTRKVLS